MFTIEFRPNPNDYGISLESDGVLPEVRVQNSSADEINDDRGPQGAIGEVMKMLKGGK